MTLASEDNRDGTVSYYLSPLKELRPAMNCNRSGRVEWFQNMPMSEWVCPNRYPQLPKDRFNQQRWWDVGLGGVQADRTAAMTEEIRAQAPGLGVRGTAGAGFLTLGLLAAAGAGVWWLMSRPVKEETTPRAKNPEDTKQMSGLKFEVIDMRGTRGFPNNSEGYVYIHKMSIKVPHGFTGTKKQKKATFVIRTDHKNKGWRVDEMDLRIATAVGDSSKYYTTPQGAARMLARHIDGLKKRR